MKTKANFINAYIVYDQHVNNGYDSGILVSENTFVFLMIQVSKENIPDDKIQNMIDDIDDTSGCLIPKTTLFMNAIYYRNYFQQGK